MLAAQRTFIRPAKQTVESAMASAAVSTEPAQAETMAVFHLTCHNHITNTSHDQVRSFIVIPKHTHVS